MKPIMLVAVVAIVVVAAAAVVMLGGLGAKGTTGGDNGKSDIVPPLVGNDSDAHGCKGSAGYSWCEAKQKCLRVWEEPCEAGAAGGTGDCVCPAGYRKEGDACNPECYYSTPKCLMPSVQCTPSSGSGSQGCIPDPNKACTMEYMPVCGKDGVTYGNRCAADAVCAEIAYTGECATGGAIGGGAIGGVGLANPASVYCEEQGGVLSILTVANNGVEGEVGMCELEDGRTCEEWALFRSGGTNCTDENGFPA